MKQLRKLTRKEKYLLKVQEYYSRNYLRKRKTADNIVFVHRVNNQELQIRRFVMNKEVSKIIAEITELAVKKNSTTKADIFFNFYGHVESMEIVAYKDGWEAGKNADYKFSNYTEQEDFIDKLQKAKEFLETIQEVEING